MQTVTVKRYLDLYQQFAAGAGTGSPIEISLDELARVLYCSTRNVKLILRRMEEDGWICWQPGRGRGNRSHLIFRLDSDTLLFDVGQQMAQRGEYKQAFELIHDYGKGSAVKDRFTEWLDLHFGYRTETMDGKEEVDTLRLPAHAPIVTLDPANVYYAFDAHIIRQLFDRLVQYDSANCRVVPALAHAWECSADATVWQFHLRKGVKFHHGREMTASDVIFTLERLGKDKSHSWLLRSLVRVEAAGNRTIRIELDKPNRIFDRFMSSAAAAILPRDLVQQDEERYWKCPIGTGPFMAKEWNEDRLVLTTNTGYFNGRAHLDGVVIAFIPAEHGDASRKCWQRLMLDHDFQEKRPEVEWESVETLWKGCTLLTWNLGKEGPQQSAYFRKAVNLLIDRNRMIQELGGERMYAARGFRPNVGRNHNDHGNAEQARALLQKSGYDGTTVTIVVRGSNIQDAKWIKQRCAELGISIRIQPLDWNDEKQRGFIREADSILYGVIFAEDDVCEMETYEQHGSFLKEHLHPEIRKWAQGKVDLALAATSAENRRAQLSEIEERLREEDHVLFLLHKKTNIVYQPGIKGVTITSLGLIDFKDLWVPSKSC